MTPTAIITGATKGIGRATAYKFLQEGYSIAICARTQQDLDTLQQEWLAEFPDRKIFALAADLENEEEVSAFAEQVLNEFKNIDVLINNAGIFLPGTVLGSATAQLRRQMEVNVIAAYIMSKAVAPKMQQQQKGHIINICSIASLQAYAGGTDYSISKYAMLGMSDNFRMALRPFKVKVTAICPGPTMSHSWEGTGVNKERLMPASDIAQLIFDCSRTSFTTCVERIVVDTTMGL